MDVNRFVLASSLIVLFFNFIRKKINLCNNATDYKIAIEIWERIWKYKNI